ncbi:hypothetical protein [unidentified bacterial endosymbiont]|uniref:hypothetical protein n=1 Tax=unidentified bacterial endosymbiont TaxID=2355 RepID=UPI0020A1DC97|nr:hypothetical protein [unidentified bacterial endosymbiont]
MSEYYCTIADQAYGAALKIVQLNLCNGTCHKVFAEVIESGGSTIEASFKSLNNLVSNKFYDDITFSNLVESLCGSLDSDNDGSYFFLSVGAVLGIGLSFCAYSFCTRVVDQNNYVKTQV